MNVKVSLDKAHIDSAIRSAVSRHLENTDFDVSCPHCKAQVKAKSGANVCPFCKKPFELTFNIES